MTKVIVFKDESGSVCVITPTDQGLALLGIDGVAKKDVPFGLPYKIMDISEVPADRELRSAWSINSDDLTDGFGADYGTGSDNAVVGYAAFGAPIVELRMKQGLGQPPGKSPMFQKAS